MENPGEASNEALLFSTSSGYCSLEEVNTAESPASSDTRSGEVSNEAQLFSTSAGYFSLGEVDIAESQASPSDTCFGTIVNPVAQDLDVIEGATCKASSDESPEEIWSPSADADGTVAMKPAQPRSEMSVSKMMLIATEPLEQQKTARRCRFLSPEETMKLSQLQTDYGIFSYYTTYDGKFTIFSEDCKSKNNMSILKTRCSEVINATASDFEVTVADSSFKGEFCTHRIGAKVTVDNRPGTVGIYIVYEDKLYMASCAHNFVTSSSEPDLPREKFEIVSTADRARFDVTGGSVSLAPWYYVFATTSASKCRGRIVLHTVDIALCIAPIIPSLIKEGKPQLTASIQKGQKFCKDCNKIFEDCRDDSHEKIENPWRYTLSGFYDFGDLICGSHIESQMENERLLQYGRYYDEKLLYNGGALVRCQPSGRRVMAGRVVSFDNGLVIFDHQRRPFHAYNVLLIKPEKESMEPKLGDSGSVWVLNDPELAVGITIGMGIGHDGKWLWAVSPMKPLLVELSRYFPSIFPCASKFETVQFSSGGSGKQAVARAPVIQSTTSSLSLTGPATVQDWGVQTGTFYQAE